MCFKWVAHTKANDRRLPIALTLLLAPVLAWAGE